MIALPNGKSPFPATKNHSRTHGMNKTHGMNAPTQKEKTTGPKSDFSADGERIAKVIARAGVCSRRDAEKLIADGVVKVNGHKLDTPAFKVTPGDRIEVKGQLLPDAEATRLWLYHKPRGLVTTHKDPEGRTTIFAKLPSELPRVISIGRLDINTEGLLLLTNDGALARLLELPKTGWLRRYRVRAYGEINQDRLDKLAEGITVDGVDYGSIDAQLERSQRQTHWITMALREGKNREIKNVMDALGLKVTRLIRTSFGPFQLAGLPAGEVKQIRDKVLRDQLGGRLPSLGRPTQHTKPKKHAHHRRRT